jgi:hypothetical protein
MRDLNLTYDTPSNRAMVAKLQKLNQMRDTNGQPMLLHQPHPMLLHQSAPEMMLNRKIGGAISGGAISGGQSVLEMDMQMPMRRPPGIVEPHGTTPKYVMANYAAGYPIYNGAEINQIDGGNLWQDMNAWGKRNEPGLKKFGKTVGDAAKKYGPAVAKLAAKGAVAYFQPELLPFVAGLGYKKPRKVKKNMEGGNIFEDMSRGFQQFGRTVGRETGKAGRTIKRAAPAIGQFAKEQGINLAKALGQVAVNAAVKKVTGGRMKGQSARGALIKKVMNEHGMSMIQASKYIKSNGLY